MYDTFSYDPSRNIWFAWDDIVATLSTDILIQSMILNYLSKDLFDTFHLRFAQKTGWANLKQSGAYAVPI